MEDNYRHQGLRKQLIMSLSKKGISDDRILDVMNKIPRHLFMDNAFINFAYQDKAFPIGDFIFLFLFIFIILFIYIVKSIFYIHKIKTVIFLGFIAK